MASSSSTENQIELPQLIQRSAYPSGPCYPSLIINELPLPLTRITGPTHDVLVPGSLTNGTWSDDDKCSFNLALYLFGKNFTDISRFVNTKEMTEIFSYYYGDFYGSDEYIRWSEFRKGKKNEKEEEGEEEEEQMNRKKKMKKTKTMSKNMYVESKKIFSGIRHRELISRLVSGASGEIPNLEVFKTFPKGTSIVDYVLFLKDVVGIKNLAGAISIGQGEIDLTRTAFKRPRSTNRVTTSRMKKTTNDETSKTIKLLQGRRRLSEAESEDLFWDTVWPRLLEKGWSLELPEGHSGPKSSFIFLVPGVDKFSGTDHVRSVHYFDSVEDVLQRVAEVPDLIEPNDEPRDGGIGCSTGPTLDIGPSCQSSAQDISPHADPSNGSPRHDPVSNAHLVEPSRDNLCGARLFDLNNLPQESESEHDNEPAITDENDMNPLRHSTRISTRTPKGKSYGESMVKNRKRKR